MNLESFNIISVIGCDFIITRLIYFSNQLSKCFLINFQHNLDPQNTKFDERLK